MRSLASLLIFLVGALSLSGATLSDITFEEPIHHVGQRPAVGAPKGVGSIRFGSPLVVAGRLDGNALQLVGRRSYEQVTISPAAAKNFVQLEFDVVTEGFSQQAYKDNFWGYPFAFRAIMQSGPNNTNELEMALRYYGPTVPSPDGVRNHVVMKIDFIKGRKTCTVNGQVVEDGYTNVKSLSLILLHLGPPNPSSEFRDELGLKVFVDNVKLTDGSVDIAAISAQWDPRRGGAHFEVSVGTQPLPFPIEVGVFWANGTTANSRLTTAPFATWTLQEGTNGEKIPLALGGDLIPAAPGAATHLLLYADHAERVDETNETNNTVPLTDVHLSYESSRHAGQVSQYSQNLVKGILRYIGQADALITSVARSPEEQAVAMFENALNKPDKVSYLPPGMAVLDVYETLTLNLSREEIIAQQGTIVAAMVDKILEVGPGNVSRHCADQSTLNVFDLSVNQFAVPARYRFEPRAEATPGISRVLSPFDGSNDPAFHLEIPQPSGLQQRLAKNQRKSSETFQGLQHSSNAVSQSVVLTQGGARVSGIVSTGIASFELALEQHDTVWIALSAKAWNVGTRFNDDDTVIYLINSQGRIVAFNDDVEGDLVSAIASYVVEETGTYTLIVTTFGNDPIVQGGRVVGWSGNGGSNVEFAAAILSVPKIVPPSMTVLFNGDIELRWEKGVLQFTPDLMQPWQEMEEATSPLVVSAGKLRGFYRVRLP